MTEVKEVVVTSEEEKAPELPKSEPPAEGTEEKPTEAEGEAKPSEEPKKTSNGVARRFTFNRKWGKARDEPPKEPEPAKDPKEDVLGWIGQQIPMAVHRVNYMILEWAQKTAIENEAERQPLPGKDGLITRNQFLGFIRDGSLLTKLANKLQPGAIEPATAEENADAAAQKEVQKKNIDNFSEWAKTQLGTEDKALTSADLLEKGKTGYLAAFDTLWQLGLKASEKFNAEGLDVDSIINAASSVVPRNILQTILGFFRRNRAAAVEKTDEKTEEKPAENGEATEPAAEEACVKVETTAPSAVAAN